MEKRWSTLAVAFIAKNLAMGTTFSCFGLLIPVLVAEFDADVATVALGIALVSLMMGTAAPLVGQLLDRWSMPGTVSCGGALAALGFALAANAQTALQFVVLYGLVAGLGITATGSVPAAKLAAAAFPAAQGKAIGLAMLPLSALVGPLLCAPLLMAFGWRALLGGFAVAMALLALLAPCLVVRRPAVRAATNVSAAVPAAVGQRAFLLLALAAAMLLSSGIVLVTYIAPHARSLGLDSADTAALLALTGGIAIPGAYLFAWLADRIAPTRVLILNATLQAFMWLLLAALPAPQWLWLPAALLGLCAGGANPTFSVYIARTYGQHRLGTMLGRLALAVVPFNVAAAPLVGWLFDEFGSYRRALAVEAVLCAIAVAALALLHRRGRDDWPLAAAVRR